MTEAAVPDVEIRYDAPLRGCHSVDLWQGAKRHLGVAFSLGTRRSCAVDWGLPGSRCCGKPLKGPGRRLPRPRYPAPADPGELALSEFIKFFIQERDAHLDNAVSSESTPAHVLALAHSAANDAIDGRFNEGR